jgi:hypothetical protein
MKRGFESFQTFSKKRVDFLGAPSAHTPYASSFVLWGPIWAGWRLSGGMSE